MKQGGKGESTPAASHEPEKEPVVRKTVQQLIDEKRKARGLPPIQRGLPDISSRLAPVLRPSNTVVKFGQTLNLREVDVLRFAKSAGIPVPEVIDSGAQTDGETLDYIEMGYIQGETLEKVWDNLSRDQRLDIAHQLRDIIRKMRSLPAPPDFIGAFNRDQLIDCRGYDTFIRPACHDEAEFNTYLVTDEEIPSPIQRGFQNGIWNPTPYRILAL
ncbi:hypothetical protein K4F52_006507 [Lecanicillium sp. MT-2017a]|nr:hypothetical protein K4F52_006507 [Lecanicillium sp. MT-2017a]